jgi:apolipoprotein N-acyltransferase
MLSLRGVIPPKLGGEDTFLLLPPASQDPDADADALAALAALNDHGGDEEQDQDVLNSSNHKDRPAPAAAMIARGVVLALAPWPFHTWSNTMAAWIFLVISCGAALFQDANEIIFLTLLQPASWLAFAAVVVVTTTTTTTNSTKNTTISSGAPPTAPPPPPQQQQRRRRWIYFGAGWIAITLCRAVPAMDYFYYDTTRLVAYMTALALIFVVYLVVGMAVLVQVSLWQHQPPSLSPGSTTTTTSTVLAVELHSFGLAILLTAFFQLLLRFSPIGGVGSPAMGLARVPALRQVASLFGEVSLVFVLAWSATIMVGLLHAKTTRKQGLVWAVVMTVLLTYGWFREGVGMGLYLQNIDAWPMATAPRLQVSCITRPDNIYSSSNTSRATMLDRTHERLMAGDDLILWSELATTTPMEWTDLDWALATNPNSIVATTFLQPTTTTADNAAAPDMSFNVVALYNTTGLVSEYRKNRPVPVVESGVTPGQIKPTAQTVTLAAVTLDSSGPNGTTISQQRTLIQRKIATAICFDLDFDYLSRHAAQADVMIGPSWYWASIGPALWYHNTFRALENGFHLLKCSERGISGHIDPRGRAMTVLPTLQGQVYTWQVPLTPGITTVYSVFGYLFGWLCVGLAPFILLYSFGCHQWLYRHGGCVET